MADFFDRALETLGAVAPSIAKGLLGPVGGLAVQAIEAALGLEPSGDKNAAMQAVANATPDQLLALKKEDNSFAIRMRELDIDLEKIGAADRDSARRREVNAHDSWTPRLLALVIVCGWLATSWFILNHSIESSMREIVTAGLRTMDNALVLMLGYYFGSMNATRAK